MKRHQLLIYSFCVILLVGILIIYNFRQTPTEVEEKTTVTEKTDSSVMPSKPNEKTMAFEHEPLPENAYSADGFLARRMDEITSLYSDAQQSDQRKILASIEAMFRDFTQQKNEGVSFADYQKCLALAHNHEEITSMLFFWAATNNFYESIDSESKELYRTRLLEIGDYASDSLSIVTVGALRRLVSDGAMHDIRGIIDSKPHGSIGVDEFRSVVSLSTVNLADQTFKLGIAKLNDHSLEKSSKLSILAEVDKLSGYGLLEVDNFRSGMLSVAGNEDNSLEIKYRTVKMLVERNLSAASRETAELELLIDRSEDLEFKRLSKKLLANTTHE